METRLPVEVELAYEVMSCQAVRIAQEPGKKPHPCSYFRKWGTWLLSMLLSTLFWGGLGVLLVLVDAVLLRYRSRLLPMGPRAWLMGAAAPFAVIGIWYLLRPGHWDGWLLGLAIAAPMLIVAVVLRLGFSPRFASK